jgi:hypothetical protein
MRNLALLLVFLFLGLLSAGEMATPVSAQVQHDPQFETERNQRKNEDWLQQRMERQQEKALNKQRQKELVRDTKKLLKLATELEEYVDKTDENVMSMEVIRKAEEIEKLAKSVKEKMKG